MQRDQPSRHGGEAKMRLEVARTRLEHASHRWAERRTPRTERDLHLAAEEFDAAERSVEGAARAWARARRDAEPGSWPSHDGNLG